MTKLLFLFSVLIGVMTNSTVSIAKKIPSSSYSSESCSSNRALCNPNLPQPCCDSNNKCINIYRTTLDAELYICLKEAKLGDTCENWFDCEAIIEAKCSEDSTCACNKFSSEWNDTICLYPTVEEQLIPELQNNYHFDERNRLYFVKTNFVSQSGFNRKSEIQYGEKCVDDDQCSELGDRGLVCAVSLKGSHECKCPEWMKFDLEIGYCTDITELPDLNHDSNLTNSEVEILDEKELNEEYEDFP
ncbi:uncharacterized protein LOC123272081 isoform X2 [Cotesia glomerata]|uniref:uncharacterized protein LOC123272081 isoform X2 n=1 Tax=Cotesia glomerata TaxID=32391 RepID=UPI001D018A8E|nr:uncharacterized protein LOC123272081 isoform X2 [Cotesia glomerata]